MLLLKQKGYSKLGLTSLLGKKVAKRHSALEDAKTFRRVCNETDICIQLEDCFTCYKIEQYLSVKLPIGIQTLYKLSREYKSHYYLHLVLLRYVKDKTSLNQKQYCLVVFYR